MTFKSFGNNDYDVLAIGEYLWDYHEETKTAAGAPFNFSYHLKNLDLEPFFVSAVGADDNGSQLRQIADALGINSEIIVNGIKTGLATVYHHPSGKNEFQLLTPAAWDAISMNEVIQDAADHASSIYFGTLAQRKPESRQTIRELVAQFHDRPRILDINLRAPYDDDELIRWSLAHCDILKVSSDEVPRLSQIVLGMRVDNTRLLAEACFRRFGLQTFVETLGRFGARAWNKFGDFTSFRPQLKPAPSTVGAGDAFTAALIRAMITDIPLVGTIEYAVQYASDFVNGELIYYQNDDID